MIKVTCKSCGNELKIKDEHAGKVGLKSPLQPPRSDFWQTHQEKGIIIADAAMSFLMKKHQRKTLEIATSDWKNWIRLSMVLFTDLAPINESMWNKSKLLMDA
jgi:hypothetical protein